jgi:hypothetical protein
MEDYSYELILEHLSQLFQRRKIYQGYIKWFKIQELSKRN